MRKLQLVLAVMFLLTSGSSIFAKSLGNYKNYQQVTDKEILIESSNGSHILVSAYNDYAIGVSILNSNEIISITSPNKIQKRKDLNGSIYVEELDEIVQITTAVADGLIIKIEKNPLRFSYINKINDELFFEEFTSAKFSRKSNNINFTIGEDEELKLFTHKDLVSYYKSINNGDVLNFGEKNDYLYPNNEICLVSSRGYAVILESDIEHEINYSKSEKIEILKRGEEKNIFSYLLIYGPRKPQLIEKYAFHMSTHEKQITMN
ncbi:MAG: hypothetical protein PF541_13860 [Prolixibacteraceae bacterium]|jgi:hypothetical protein|nr:hypothetical protein [Prolixibacteraceae bacterium]